jgi:hypothetical protein
VRLILANPSSRSKKNRARPAADLGELALTVL